MAHAIDSEGAMSTSSYRELPGSAKADLEKLEGKRKVMKCLPASRRADFSHKHYRQYFASSGSVYSIGILAIGQAADCVEAILQLPNLVIIQPPN